MPAPDLLDAFDRQARWCREPAPFTARVLERSRRWLEDDAAARRVLAALDADPVAAAVPLRWVGALHHLALLGRQPWASLWPPAMAQVADADIDAAIRAAWREQQPMMQAALALPPQTNEVQRSAALLPGLLHVAQITGRPLVLLEIGASAGLNLWCDRYRHDHGRWAWGTADAALSLRCDWRGMVPVAQAGAHLHIARRAACDRHPVDLTHAGEGLRLASFIWADQRERLQRFQQAQASVARWMAAEGVTIEAARAADFVSRELAAPARDHATVLMQSVVWQYIGAGERSEIAAAVEAAGAAASADAPLAWLRLEPPAADQHLELRCRLWPGGRDHLLARAHPHVTHLEWLGEGAT